MAVRTPSTTHPPSSAAPSGPTRTRPDAPPPARVPEPAPGPPPIDERASDVDEWGRSQTMRDLLGRAYGPFYDHWFRVEWEGLDKVPRTGGALLVGNHAGAIPDNA